MWGTCTNKSPDLAYKKIVTSPKFLRLVLINWAG